MAVNNGFFKNDGYSISCLNKALDVIARQTEQMKSIRPGGPNNEAVETIHDCIRAIQEIQKKQEEDITTAPRFS